MGFAMHVIPKNAIRLSSFVERKRLTGSCNDVRLVDYNGEVAFYKPINERYTELLAKVVVAANVHLRMVLGNRVAREHLVYDEKNNKPLGTLSLCLEAYQSLQFQSVGDPSGVELNTDLLLEHNIIADYLALYFRGDVDRHPKNHCLSGIIDFDECFYDLTHIIKGTGVLNGIMDNAVGTMTAVSASDLETFPMVGVERHRRHWPTHPSVNRNPMKRYIAENIFQQLAANKKAIVQKNRHLMKELLAFQPHVLEQRLTDEIGNEFLNLEAFDKTGRGEALRTYIKEKLGENYLSKKEPIHFVKFFVDLSQVQFITIEREIFNYFCFLSARCEMPLLSDEFLDWFKRENMKFSDGSRLDLKLMAKKYKHLIHDIVEHTIGNEFICFLTRISHKNKEHISEWLDALKKLAFEISPNKVIKGKALLIEQRIVGTVRDALSNRVDEALIRCCITIAKITLSLKGGKAKLCFIQKAIQQIPQVNALVDGGELSVFIFNLYNHIKSYKLRQGEELWYIDPRPNLSESKFTFVGGSSEASEESQSRALPEDLIIEDNGPCDEIEDIEQFCDDNISSIVNIGGQDVELFTNYLN